MKKRFIWIAAGLLVIGGLIEAVVLLRNSEPESGAFTAKELAAHALRLGVTVPASASNVVAAKPISPSQPIRLAVGWLGLPDETQNRQVGDLLVAQLGSVKNLQMVDRQSLDAVLRETQLSYSGLVRAQSAVQLGKLLRADWFLLGSAVKTGGSNGVVVRVVDARTGVFRDAAVFYTGSDVARLATDVAAFVRQCRDAASKPPKPRTYLAIGGFQDVSINNRQADFAAKLRGYLTAAFRNNANVTLLERESVDALFEELRLDLAGLTEGDTNTVTPMQAAFWTVDGIYQSYEVNAFEVEVVVRVNRMFGRTGELEPLRGPPDEALMQKLNYRIGAAIAAADPRLLAPTRNSESRQQLQLAVEYANGVAGSNPGGYIPDFDWGSTRERTRKRQYLDEAIRSLETVLLLEPEHREAKIRLAACLEHPLIGRKPEANNLVREVADASPGDQWTARATEALARYSEDGDTAKAIELYKRAEELFSKHVADGIYKTTHVLDIRRRVKELTASLEPRKATPFDSSPPLEKQLAEHIQAEQAKLGKDRGLFPEDSELFDDFLRGMGTNRADGVQRLNELLPKLAEAYPSMAPRLFACALSCQLETNSTAVKQFIESFGKCNANPDAIADKAAYFWRLERQCYTWCIEHKMYDLAIQLVEAKSKAQVRKDGLVDPAFTMGAGVYSSQAMRMSEIRLDLEDNARLIYAYRGLGRWQQVMDILKEYPAYPVSVNGTRPWNGLFMPTELLAECREKLGLPAERDPQQFSLGECWWKFSDPAVFTTDSNSFWGAVCCRLWRSDLDLGTNGEIKLPKKPNTQITALHSGSSKLWIGTKDEGLIEYDKKTGNARVYKDSDGLLVDGVASAYEKGDDLWLGFDAGIISHSRAGGFGRLDLRTGRATAFTKALRGGSADPPLSLVKNMIEGPSDDLFMINGNLVFRYRIKENSWDKWFSQPVSIAADTKRTVMTTHGSRHSFPEWRGIGLGVQNAGETNWTKIKDVKDLPSVDLEGVALDGKDVWVNSRGFVAAVEVESRTVRKIAYVNEYELGHMEIAGGCLWVQSGQGFYRVPLSETK